MTDEEHIEAEFEAWHRIDWHAERMSHWLPLIWKYGDGYGGAVRLRIEEIFERAGFTREPRDNSNKKRKPIRRRQILEVSGARCIKCGNRESLVIDHIVPLARGGSDEPDNLQVLCAECNSRKGIRDN